MSEDPREEDRRLRRQQAARAMEKQVRANQDWEIQGLRAREAIQRVRTYERYRRWRPRGLWWADIPEIPSDDDYALARRAKPGASR